ncbi:hypothetical protein [Thermomonospora echinospora]|nr:hypothetical protein [Thermomonospora echinospora]
MVGGQVLSAPEVQQALTTGDVQISSPAGSRRQTEDMVRRILGSN